MHGFRLAVLNEQGVEVCNEHGQLAVDLWNSPLMWFKGYRNDKARTNKAHSSCGRYYLTGDVVEMTTTPPPNTSHQREGEEPLFWYSSRGDDVITSSGYRIGPFDVENSLMKDPRVAEVMISETFTHTLLCFSFKY